MTLEARLASLIAALLVVAAALATALARFFAPSPWIVVLSAALVIPVACFAAVRFVRPVHRLLRALDGAVSSFRDGDFSFSIVAGRRDVLGELVERHNQLSHTLRVERQNLTQRELLLDTLVQNTPVALVLTGPDDRVAYANLAARHLLNDGRTLVGAPFAELLARCPEAMREAIASTRDALFTVEIEGAEEIFHVSQREFRLQGRAHRLHLFRQMTRELARQEVATWKKVIRVMSHEINNSLAPISSMAHSGAELARRAESARLVEVFAALGERARHLNQFIEGYARFAKLPAPRYEAVSWRDLLERLGHEVRFRIAGSLPDGEARLDSGQIEQALVNLLKNAHEAAGRPEAVELEVRAAGSWWRIEVRDSGSGMSDTVLANALLPFYSTKHSGTGLGLALAREIVEAHGGRIQLANRPEGGLVATLLLPR